ncbi:MAG TPA: OmpA family protein [Bacteroidia bacterium]|nr:OmpA family protein [Bacteroidia bacterium]
MAKANADTVKITITNLGKTINTSYPEYAPVISADGEMLVFTSRRPVTEKEIKKGKMGMENVYLSNLDTKKKKWADAVRLSAPVNQDGRHNSAIALSNDGQRMLLYRDDESGNGDIYESHLVGSNWTEPVKLDEPVNSKNHESSASISPDGKTIYFISNRKGGQGGRDIWMCTFNNNKWDKAESLGSVVNTPEDEEGVFIHPDGKTLYFSSKGHNSTGGYDIFKTTYDNGKWTEPISMGPHINTIDDDLYFVLAANGQTGFYSSAKPGGLGDKDIYEIRFTPLKPKKEKAAEGPQLTLLKGVITDEDTKAPLEADIEIIDNVKNQTITTIKSNGTSGKYLVSLPSGKNYGIIVKVKGYLFHSENVDIPYSAGYQEIIKDIQLKKLEVGKSIVLNNIFYDFDKATLRPESMSELERLVQLLNENPTLTIELSSHTDNKGTDEYNQKLSQQRAQSVVDFLINKNIAKNRLVAKGYGETVPVATNDTDEGRQQNRRTEFKILSR